MSDRKPWLNRGILASVYARPEIKNDEDAAKYFREVLRADVSRRTITDARNSFGIAAKAKSDVYEVEVKELEPPRILFIDIETRPNLGYFWRLYDENIGISQLVEEHQLLSFAAKWRGEEETHFFSEYEHGHEIMVAMAHEFLDTADFVIHWNGKRFDIPHLNKEFVLLELTPPSAYKQLDLMLTARSQFKFASNKLQHISTRLGLEGKFEHEGFELWLKCMANDPEAWETMRKYNIQDVVLLEQIYDKILPWIKQHPNVPLYTGTGDCPACGSSNIRGSGTAYMTSRTYPKFTCNDCGAQMRGTKSNKDSAAGYVPLSY